MTGVAAAGWFGKLVGAVGGGPTLAALAVGGLVVGGLGGAAAGGAFGGGTASGAVGPTLAIYPCPGAGSPMAEVGAGQRMLATGRSADGAWLRVHFPAPGRSEGWVIAAAVSLEKAPDALPVADCTPEAGAPSPVPEAAITITAFNSPSPGPFVEPTPTPTPEATPTPTPEATPSPTPSRTARPTARPTVRPTAKPTVRPTAKPTPTPKATPTPTPKPTPTPTPTPVDTQGPTILNVLDNTTRVSWDCSSIPDFFRVQGDVTDPSGVSDVTLITTFEKPTASGAAAGSQKSFVLSLQPGGTSTYATIKIPAQTFTPGHYSFRITAHDGKGNATTVASSLTVFDVYFGCGGSVG